ncbi:MAG: enoyl-CoA hydratase-related protein, partial [Candidatus Hermodarchaeota archaeon]
MEMIQIHHHEKVGILQLNREVTNALNMTLINQLAEALQKLREDSDIHSVVLTSSNEKFFAIGFDIPELFELS